MCECSSSSACTRLEPEREAGLGGGGLPEAGYGSVAEIISVQTAGGHGNGVGCARVALTWFCGGDVVRRSRGAGAQEGYTDVVWHCCGVWVR